MSCVLCRLYCFSRWFTLLLALCTSGVLYHDLRVEVGCRGGFVLGMWVVAARRRAVVIARSRWSRLRCGGRMVRERFRRCCW